MSNRKKGLFLIHLPPPVHGVSVINQWIINSEKINQSIQIDMVNLATARSIQDIGKQGLGKYIKLIKIYGAFIYKLLTNRYNFLYITLSPLGSAFIKDSLLILLARLFSMPIVIHLHGKGINTYLKSAPKWKFNYYNFVFKNSYVIHLAKTLLADINLIHSYKKAFVLNNGIQKIAFDSTKSNQIHILHLSNFLESKGGLTLLKSVKLLVDSGATNFKVHYVGNWDNETYKSKFYDYIKDNNLKNIIEVHGPLYAEDKKSMLALSDIFVLPTYYPNECFPLTILEAMQAGLPVISSFEGAIPEIIKDGVNGYLVEAKDTKKLAEKIQLVLSSESLRESMKQNALHTFETNYTFSIFENNFLNILNKVSS